MFPHGELVAQQEFQKDQGTEYLGTKPVSDHEAPHQVTSSPGWELEPFQWDIEETHQKLDKQSEVTGYRPGLLRSPSPLLVLRLSAFFPLS